jgi:Cu-Zn family superoxide dismutase
MSKFIIGLICTFCIINPSFGQKAKADLVNSNADSVGVIYFTQTDSGVLIALDLKSLPLGGGTCAIHIHQFGACQGPDFKSAGEHFNPTAKQHGFLNSKGLHAGDLPNIEVGLNGTVKDTIFSQIISLKIGDRNTLLTKEGTSIVVHSQPDDYFSQPAGNSGNRIACGVIREIK